MNTDDAVTGTFHPSTRLPTVTANRSSEETMSNESQSDGSRKPPSQWLTVTEAADHARCGPKLIYREVRAKRLKAARVGGRRELRLLPEWVDAWLLEQTTIL